jgi:hypothetical protein
LAMGQCSRAGNFDAGSGLQSFCASLARSAMSVAAYLQICGSGRQTCV